MAAAAEAKPSASASAIFPFLVSRCPRSREPEASAAAAAAGSIRGAAAASDPAPAWWRPLAPSSPRRSTADPPAAAGEHARSLAAAPLPPLLASFSRACGWDGSSNSCGSREEKRVRACVLPLPAPVCFRSACLLRSRCFLPPAARYSSQVCSRGFNPTSGAPLFQLSSRPLPSPLPCVIFVNSVCPLLSSPPTRCFCARDVPSHMYSAPRAFLPFLTSRTSSSVLLSLGLGHGKRGLAASLITPDAYGNND